MTRGNLRAVSTASLLLTYLREGEQTARSCSSGEAFDLDAIKANGGIVINRQHTRGAPIVRVVPELRGDELVIDHGAPGLASRVVTRLSRFESGLMRGLSVEFNAIRARMVNGVRRISGGNAGRRGAGR